jgi:hypothetical protein
MKNRNEIHLLLKEKNCKIGIELGVARGAYSKYLIDNMILIIFFV